MNFQHFRFAPGIDQKDHIAAYPPTTQLQQYQIIAIKSVASLMESFTRIEEGLARTVITATGLNVPGKPEIWKPLVKKLRKNFTVEQSISMVEDLVDCEALELVEPYETKLPTGFSKAELPFFHACRLAMNYRNELAHNWYIFYVSEHDGQYVHSPFLGLDNPRSSDKNDVFTPVNISSTEFLDWVYNIANRLPYMHIGAPAIKPTNTPCDAIPFFKKHKKAALSQLDKAKQSKEKSIDKFVNSLSVENETSA